MPSTEKEIEVQRVDSEPHAITKTDHRVIALRTALSILLSFFVGFFQLLLIALHKSEYISRQTNAITECPKLMRPPSREILICNIAF